MDYREDCALFWLEISDLLKIPSSTAAGGVSSFQMGLMDDLYDVYAAKGLCACCLWFLRQSGKHWLSILQIGTQSELC